MPSDPVFLWLVLAGLGFIGIALALAAVLL